MQEDSKIDVHAVQRVHFVPRPDGGLGFALVIETKDRGALGFALPLTALVEIFGMLPKMFADLLRSQTVSGDSIPESMTHVYWDSLASVIANLQIATQSASQTKSTLPFEAAATVKSEVKKTSAKTPTTATAKAKSLAKSVTAKTIAVNAKARTKAVK
jgi:hypothetical protein